MELVSVIIPAFNQDHYIERAIQSVLKQTYTHVEAVVVNDGSTDDTADVVNAIDDARIHYIYQDNRGLSGARNTGIRASKGSYLSYLDADDEFLPEKLNLLVAEMKERPEVGLVAGQAIPVDDRGQQIGKVFDRGIPEDHSLLLHGNPLHVGSVLVSSKWQRRAGFFDEDLRSYEDWDMWLRLAKEGCEMVWVDHPVSLYRFHPHQMTRDGSQMTAANFAVLEKVYQDEEIPESWWAQQDLAYSNAYLRASAHGYLAGDYQRGKENLSNAVELDKSLLDDHASPLRDRFSSWIDLPKTNEPLTFLENVYNNLPEELRADISPGVELGKAAMRLAFQAYKSGDRRYTRSAVWRAIRYHPAWLLNRGAISILVRSSLHFSH